MKAKLVWAEGAPADLIKCPTCADGTEAGGGRSEVVREYPSAMAGKKVEVCARRYQCYRKGRHAKHMTEVRWTRVVPDQVPF